MLVILCDWLKLPFSGHVGQAEAEPEAATVAPRPAMVSGKASGKPSGASRYGFLVGD